MTAKTKPTPCTRIIMTLVVEYEDAQSLLWGVNGLRDKANDYGTVISCKATLPTPGELDFGT